MINRQDVLMGLVCCSESSGYGCNWCPYSGECRETTLSGCRHLCADALELLEEHPVDTKVIGTFNGDIEVYCCQDCRTTLDPAFHYCPNCGRAVKWG